MDVFAPSFPKAADIEMQSTHTLPQVVLKPLKQAAGRAIQSESL